MAVQAQKLADRLDEERARHRERTARSRSLFQRADHLFGRVPMTWMNKWSGGYPLYLATAHGNRVTDVDGNEYVDFALGDTGAMAGHSPAPTIAAITRQVTECFDYKPDGSYSMRHLSVAYAEPLRAELTAFVEAVRTGAAPVTGGADGLASLDIAMRCLGERHAPILQPKLVAGGRA